MEEIRRVQEKRLSGLHRLISKGPLISAVLMLCFSLAIPFLGMMAHPAGQLIKKISETHHARFFKLNVLRVSVNNIYYYPPSPCLDPNVSHTDISAKANNNVNMGAEWLVTLPAKKDINAADIAYWGSGNHVFYMELEVHNNTNQAQVCHVYKPINTPIFTAEDLADLGPNDVRSISWMGVVANWTPGNETVGQIYRVDTSIGPISWQTAEGSQQFYHLPLIHVVDKFASIPFVAKAEALPRSVRAPRKH